MENILEILAAITFLALVISFIGTVFFLILVFSVKKVQYKKILIIMSILLLVSFISVIIVGTLLPDEDEVAKNLEFKETVTKEQLVKM